MWTDHINMASKSSIRTHGGLARGLAGKGVCHTSLAAWVQSLNPMVEAEECYPLTTCTL